MTASVTVKLKAQQGHETGPWEVRRGVYTGVDDLAVWPVGADGRGENRVACWINSEANARLIAAAPDHALYAAALTAGFIRWEPFGIGCGGEICVCGLRYSTTIDEFGVPEIHDAVRPAIVKAIASARNAIREGA